MCNFSVGAMEYAREERQIEDIIKMAKNLHITRDRAMDILEVSEDAQAYYREIMKLPMYAE